MTYNIHPIFVHFPIACLFVYSLLRILPLSRWFPQVAWKDIERIFLVVGVGGAFLALSTGESAEHLVRPNHQLVEAHALFASIATWLYGALLAGEAATLLLGWEKLARVPSWVRSILTPISTILTNPGFALLLSVLGFIAILITGVLGGVISYGTLADPLAKPLLSLLGITL